MSETWPRAIAVPLLIIVLLLGVARAEDAVKPRIIDGTNVPESQFSTVGRVGDALNNGKEEFYCSGTLISPRHFVTAGHCVCDSSGIPALFPTEARVRLGGVTYKSARIFPHPTYQGEFSFLAENNFDVAIIELETSVPITPNQLYRVPPNPVPAVNTILTIAGFGLVGEGTKGVGFNSEPPPEGTIEFGTTRLETVTPTYLKWKFDDVAAPNNEANTSPGDSGGPAFITVGGVKLLAAVTTGGSNFTAAFGDNSFDTRLDPIMPWIDRIINNQPANDPFADAIPIYGSLISAQASSVGASFQTGEPLHAGIAGGVSVWWKWTAPSSGPVTISTTGSDFDTLLAVYTGKAVNALTAVASNNDDPAAPSGQRTSALTFTATGGKTYMIAVDGVSAATGKINLSLSLKGNADLSISSIEAFPEIPVPGEEVTFIVTVFNGGTADGSCSLNFWPDLAQAPTLMTRPVFSDFVDVAAGEKGIVFISVIAPRVPNPTAWAFVDSYLGISEVAESDETNNAMSFPWTVNTILLNDNFKDATQLPEGDVLISGTNAGATKEPGEPNHAGKAGGTSIWYKWTAAATGITNVNTFGSSFDTLLAVYTGASVSSLTQVAANDDKEGDLASTVDFAAIAGKTYYIAVDGVNKAFGRVFVSITGAEVNELDVKRAQIRFNFKQPTKDSLMLSGSLDLVNSPGIKETPVTIIVGSITKELKLDAKLKSSDKDFRLIINRRTAAAKFTFTLKDQPLFDKLGELGFQNADVKADTVILPVIIVIGTDSYGANLPLTYKAKAGVSGQAKL